MKWIILCVVLTVLISQSYCFPTKADSTANKGKTNEVTMKSTPIDDDDDYDGLLKILLASKLGNMKSNDDDDDDDINNFISNLQQAINKNDNSDNDDDDDDDMSTMLGILAMQNKDMFDSNKTIKKQYWGTIFRGGYRIYKYCRSHPRNYYCKKGKHYGRRAFKKFRRWFG